MKIKNLSIKEGQTVRKVVRIKGKKFYAEVKCVALYSYEASHGRDLRKTSTSHDN